MINDNNNKNSKNINPKQKAVALSYNLEDVSPKIVAKGKGYIAQKILENAKSSEIPVYEDSALVDELTKVDLGSNIPPELYEVVAQVLVFISDLDKYEGIRRYESKK